MFYKKKKKMIGKSMKTEKNQSYFVDFSILKSFGVCFFKNIFRNFLLFKNKSTISYSRLIYFYLHDFATSITLLTYILLLLNHMYLETLSNTFVMANDPSLHFL